jgi:hypothetical protein
MSGRVRTISDVPQSSRDFRTPTRIESGFTRGTSSRSKALPSSTSAVEAIEVITPFRRLELIAEEHARINDLFARGGIQDAEEALAPWRDLVAIVAHVRFDQTKIVVGVPELSLTLEGSGVVFPLQIRTSEIYSGSGQSEVAGRRVGRSGVRCSRHFSGDAGGGRRLAGQRSDTRPDRLRRHRLEERRLMIFNAPGHNS